MKKWEENLSEIHNMLMNYKEGYREYLVEKYSAYKYICIFGAGNLGIANLMAFKKLGIKVDFWCDNDTKKQGQLVCGIPCISPEELKNRKDETMVIISSRVYKVIKAQIEQMGIQYTDRVFVNKLSVDVVLKTKEKDDFMKDIEKATYLLEDEMSKDIFTTVVKNWISLDYRQDELDRIYSDDQYLCEDIFQLGDSEIFVDGGAYDGDTFRLFYDYVKGQYKEAFLFEMSESNFNQMKENIRIWKAENVVCENKGLSEKSAVIRYKEEGENSVMEEDGDKEGALISIDEYFTGKKVTYIKMDIEGSEEKALYGAREMIKAHKPKLAICIYHKFEDLWNIPVLIHELCPEYKIYVRHHTDLLNETVCYAVL